MKYFKLGEGEMNSKYLRWKQQEMPFDIKVIGQTNQYPLKGE